MTANSKTAAPTGYIIPTRAKSDQELSLASVAMTLSIQNNRVRKTGNVNNPHPDDIAEARERERRYG